MPLEAGIGQTADLRHPTPDEQQHDQPPTAHQQESSPPGQHLAERRAERHAEQVGDRHARDHDRHGLGAFSLVGQLLGNDRAHAEIGSVRQSRNEARQHQHAVAGRNRSAQIARDHQAYQYQQNPLERKPTCENQRRGPDAHAERIGGNQMPGSRYAHMQVSGDIRQNRHHDELGYAERERSESQRDKTFFHTVPLFFRRQK